MLVLVVLLVVVGAVVLDRLLLAAEARGWIYYRTRRAGRGAAAERLQQLGTIWDPSQQHWLAQKDWQEDAADVAEDPSDD